MTSSALRRAWSKTVLQMNQALLQFVRSVRPFPFHDTKTFLQEEQKNRLGHRYVFSRLARRQRRDV
jgi:hypothetical protein